MKTNELREAFLSFFESKGCVRKPSDALVPQDDTTVLFTPAGMNQFKREFLGMGEPNFKRATTCQKCLRTGDIENVGKTAYHHTFFEMLGNFSFGDYFKEDAICWAWEFCTSAKWLGLPQDQLSVTVYLDDDEAADIWTGKVGLPAAKVQRMDEDDNFWPAAAPSQGPDGVCGPCSEIFFHPVNGKEVEIWNLVFTQFNRVGDPPDNLQPLPSKNIDTGMGLERTAAVLQGVPSNFDIDIFKSLLAAIADVVKSSYEGNSENGARMRRIADHARAVTFCVHENVFPSNKKAGYVVRRLLRRAVLDGYRLGMRDPFFHKLVAAVVEAMRSGYPELCETAETVANVIGQEEERFFKTLDTGVAHLDRLFANLGDESENIIPGDEAFKLHDTYGFPIELTESLAADRGVAVDQEGFSTRLERQREQGDGAFSDRVFDTGPLDALRRKIRETEFLGYDHESAESEVVGILQGDQVLKQLGNDQPAALVLAATPFYGESGGQVGDRGSIRSGSLEFTVQDTRKDGGFTLHLGRLESGSIELGQRVTAEVEGLRRARIKRAHSATHVLHHALRQVLGKHATQAGSKVDEDHLRFDFTHPQAVTREQLVEIERIVNDLVRSTAKVGWQTMPIEQARSKGAMALFGEKYGEVVRVVEMGDFSVELCGGTHLRNTGEIGWFKITGEESVAASTRRIVAVTGPAASDYFRQQEEVLRELSGILKSPPAELPRRAVAVLEEIKTLKKKASERKTASFSLDSALKEAKEVAGTKLVAIEIPDADQDQLRRWADQIKGKATSYAALLASGSHGKVQMIAAVSEDLVQGGLRAPDWIKPVARIVQGGGGGRPNLAQAGGKLPEKIPEALKKAVEVAEEALGG